MFIVGILLFLGLPLLGMLYLAWLIERDDIIFNIYYNWMITNDVRHEKYTYDSCMKLTKKNFFGLKYPKDSDF